MLGLAAALLTLIAASIYDLRAREVPAKLFVAGFAASLALGLVEAALHGTVNGLLLAYGTVVNGLIMVALYLLVRLNHIGEGDLVAYATVWAATALNPLNGNCLFPFLFTVVAYSVALQALPALAILFYNVVFNLSELRKLPWRLRVVYSFTAIPVTARRAVSLKGWWYPLTFCSGSVATFDIREDAWAVRERLRRDLESGCMKPDQTVWVTYGIPAVPFIAVGLALSLVARDSLILLLLKACGWALPPCIG